jgi:tRNA (mo5U34)-methyltransferase
MIDYPRLLELRQEMRPALALKTWESIAKAMGALHEKNDLFPPDDERLLQFGKRRVKIGTEGNINPVSRISLEEIILGLRPWRKGPFELFNIEIDAEWQSDRKWSRVFPHLDSLVGKIVGDIGCGNGYYLMRLLEHSPSLVLGLDPSQHFYYQFELLQTFARQPHAQYEPIGIEAIDIFSEFFDVLLCMGVLYHHRNPIACLQGLREALKRDGQLLIECQSIPGEQAMALFPPGRYAKMRNVYFVPTAACLEAWIKKAGFVDIKVCSDVEVTCEEQRRTDFSPNESLADFLDPNDPTLTVEGHPAPRRVIVSARKP